MVRGIEHGLHRTEHGLRTFRSTPEQRECPGRHHRQLRVEPRGNHRRTTAGSRGLGRLRQRRRQPVWHAERRYDRHRRRGPGLEDGWLLGTIADVDNGAKSRQPIRLSRDRSRRAVRDQVLGDRQRNFRHRLLRSMANEQRRLRCRVFRMPLRSLQHESCRCAESFAGVLRTKGQSVRGRR